MLNIAYIEKSKSKFGDKFDYSLLPDHVLFNKGKVDLICNKHGKISVNARNHLVSETGCQFCSNKKTTNEFFIEKAIKVHGNKYDYSKLIYKNAITKIILTCKIHGDFSVWPGSHLNGSGCSKCNKCSNSLKLTTEQFVEKARKIHNDKYDYQKSIYKSAFEKLTITCPIHGEFEQSASDHANNGRGCPKCSRNILKNDWLKSSNAVHNYKYDYSKVNYINLMDKVTIICPDHGPFDQRMYCHIHKAQGCPLCPIGDISDQHQEVIDYIKSIYNGEMKINDKEIIKPKEIDIYIPEKKLAIEYNGLFWHSVNDTSIDKRHVDKANMCNNVNVNLFMIWEHEWRDKKEILKSMITNKLGLSKRVYARECEIKVLNNIEYNMFMSENHLQGSVHARFKFGLVKDDKILCAIGIKNHHEFQYEISRIATKRYFNVVGGASRLLNYFIKNIEPNKIMSYANKSHSNGNLYVKLGFKHLYDTQPGYFYTKLSRCHSRQAFQKHKLAKKLKEFDPELSEIQNMLNNKYRRMFDCGHKKYIWIAKVT